ncbi:beta-1,3-glucanase family protein [Kineosporia sp. NBRC 101731]|uniref:beta-1,3-glucanase family protein n=1 Tax=Kineosporia sp. NBRC 101731 TaxID=3032199 RepID=UPI0024A3A455|nr:beta-1,3-glucanase family protein [Kineosporia sp. NBRC 101731]GLY26975.1 glycosyl hydrolase [Kineosporia sp. NBRC 101731]
MPNLSRRNLFLGALGGGALGAAGLLAVPELVHAANKLPLKIVNNTGRWSSDKIWVHVVGTELSSGRMGHVKANGTFVAASLADNGANGYAAYGMRLSSLKSIPMARLSGRIYISMGQPLKFKVVGSGNSVGIQYPAGWVKTDPSYKILHDFMEFTYDGGFHTNTTAVDMFGLPMYITLTGARKQTTGRFASGSRAKVFAEIRKQPGFKKLAIGNLRVIAPSHGLDRGIFSNSYLDPYIDARWEQYASKTLTVVANNQTYLGRVEGSKLVFRQDGAVKASFVKPSTRDVLFCDGALNAPNDGVGGPIAAVVAAGLNRGVLHRTKQPIKNDNLYYRPSRTNHYARILHEHTVNGKAYGFAFDDVCEQASFVTDPAPKSVTLTLQAF